MKSESGRITHIRLEHFRNHRSLSCECDTPVVLLTGANGSGKTNILEAVSILASGRGLRSAPSSDLVTQGSRFPWAVYAGVSGRGEKTALKITGDASGRRLVRDGIAVRDASELKSVLCVSWLTPSMDSLLGGAASERRRFLDRFVSNMDENHAARVLGFDKLTRERAGLLSWRGGDDAWLQSIEQQMARLAIAITHSRHSALRQLAGSLEHIVDDLGASSSRFSVALEGYLACRSLAVPAADLEAEYAQKLSQGRAEDGRSGRLGCGPHRDDLVVRDSVSGLLARQCSTGQRKSMLMIIVLAQARILARRGGAMASILLLDEVSAHLDERSRALLLGSVERYGSQVWLTGTEDELFSGLTTHRVHFTVGIPS